MEIAVTSAMPRAERVPEVSWGPGLPRGTCGQGKNLSLQFLLLSDAIWIVTQ